MFFKLDVLNDMIQMQLWTRKSVCLWLHSLCILQGGAEDFFFSGSFFYIPPPRSIQIFRTPQAISRKINTPPPPSPLPRNIKINICIIVNYICLKSQETCLIRIYLHVLYLQTVLVIAGPGITI